MSDKFEDYLGVLPLTKVIKDRINVVLSLNKKIIDDDVLDIFICEMKNNEGVRTYTSLWLFTDNYCIECKSFLTNNDFDVSPIKKQLGYCSIMSSEFDFEVANEKSSVNIDFSFRIGMSGNLIATEQNCIKAFEIYKKHIVSNLNL